MQLDPEDILVSLDVKSVVIKVPVKTTSEPLKEHFDFDDRTIALFYLCLTSTYFLWNGTYYEQKDGVAMGSPLSSIVADFFIENFQKDNLHTAPYKPRCWLRYVVDTFGHMGIKPFHDIIRFAMEVKTKKNRILPFLDTLVSRQTTT